MPHPDAEHWNARYAGERETWLRQGPRELLVDYAHLLPASGLALDAAAGVAANGLFLAERGLRVIALDVSETGLRMAMWNARARSLPLQAALSDLSQPWFPAACFSVIVNFRFLERATLPAYYRALQPGGLLFFEALLKMDEARTYPYYYLKRGELRQAMQGFEVLHWAERSVSGGERVVEQLIARKV